MATLTLGEVKADVDPASTPATVTGAPPQWSDGGDSTFATIPASSSGLYGMAYAPITETPTGDLTITIRLAIPDSVNSPGTPTSLVPRAMVTDAAGLTRSNLFFGGSSRGAFPDIEAIPGFQTWTFLHSGYPTDGPLFFAVSVEPTTVLTLVVYEAGITGDIVPTTTEPLPIPPLRLTNRDDLRLVGQRSQQGSNRLTGYL